MIRVVLRLVFQGFKDLSINPWAQFFTLGAVALVAFLSGLFLMSLVTLNHQLGTARGQTAVQVYWKVGTSLSTIQEQCEQVKHMPYFAGLKFFEPQDALKELNSRLGHDKKSTPEKNFSFLTSNNPLPATALVTFSAHDGDFDSWLKQTSHYLQNLTGVDKVVVTPLRDELGQAWRKISHYIMWPSVFFLCLVLGLVVGNTIRLSMWSKAHEIEILQLVGAKNWYIRLPLLVSGTFLGFFGGLIALLLLWFVHSQIYDVLNFPPLLFSIQFLPWELCLALVFVPALMGSVASWLGVRNYNCFR